MSHFQIVDKDDMIYGKDKSHDEWEIWWMSVKCIVRNVELDSRARIGNYTRSSSYINSIKIIVNNTVDRLTFWDNFAVLIDNKIGFIPANI